MVFDEKIVRGGDDATIFPGIAQMRWANLAGDTPDYFVADRIVYPDIDRRVAIAEVLRPALEVSMAAPVFAVLDQPQMDR